MVTRRARGVGVFVGLAAAPALLVIACYGGHTVAPGDAAPTPEAGPADDGGVDVVSCPNDLPKACPDAAPSYQTTIAPLVDRRCSSCHSGATPIGTYDFSTYDGLATHRSLVLNQVYGCRMPPADAAPPTAEERAALLGWLVCRAPNN